MSESINQKRKTGAIMPETTQTESVKLTYPLYQVLAQKVQWYHDANGDWKNKAESEVKALCDMLPHGSGIDAEREVDLEASSGSKIIINLSYHHMDENGFYDGWTSHSIIIRPSLTNGFDLKVTGKDRNEIKGYLAEIFDADLRQPVEYPFHIEQ
jgi:hypothetical protein